MCLVMTTLVRSRRRRVVSGDQLSGMLAAVLPHIIDRATPNGQVPPGLLDLTDVLGSLGRLAGLFGKSEGPKQG